MEAATSGDGSDAAAESEAEIMKSVPALKLSPDGMILRESFTRERLEALRAAMAKLGDRTLLTHEEREENRTRFMRQWDGRSDLWVFGYGSLMWNPAIHVAETKAAKVHGLHRAFCLHLTLGRGTPRKPGLMLGLDHGGSCRGLAHRITADQVESETEILWMREMLGGAYKPVWLHVHLEGHDAPVKGFTYAINRDHPRYAGKLDLDTQAKRIARAEGQLGTNRAYLYRTVERLDALGIGDGPMHQLLARVKDHAPD